MKVKSMENTLNGKGLAVQNQKKKSATLLNTDNKLEFLFNYEDLVITVPGGLNDDRLDSLRVTLCITKEGTYIPIRHNINLYNDTQVEKFIRKLSYRLQVNDIPIRKAFILLINELVSYRNEMLTQEPEDSIVEYEIPDEERIEAETLLKSNDLLSQTNNLIGLSGIVGEVTNRLLVYLIFTSRIMQHPLHCISYGKSGTGKTFLQSKVSELMPPQDIVDFTEITANSLYYAGKKYKNKLIIIEDLDGVGDALYPLRELQSKGRITKSITHKGTGGIGKAKRLVTEGPICVSACTTSDAIYEDNENRSIQIYIDQSPEQDERIMEYQRLGCAGKIDKDEELRASKLLCNVQRLLRPIKVINPFAEHLKIPSQVLKPRRTNMHYLHLIEVVTFYHQFQREKLYDEITGEEYIETTLEDIIETNRLIKDVFLRKSDPLNGATRDFFSQLTDYLKDKKSNTYFNHEIRRDLRIKETTLRRRHKILLDEGYIRKRPDISGLSDCYEVLHVDEFKETEKAIEQALQLCIELASSPQVRHTQNGESKTLNTSKLN